LLSSVVGAVVGITMMLMGPNTRETKIPFGPYLTGAGLLALLYGPQIQVAMQAYLQPA
jgi:leader peptidase (prepilin peptidase)/N-methyltransferase